MRGASVNRSLPVGLAPSRRGTCPVPVISLDLYPTFSTSPGSNRRSTRFWTEKACFPLLQGGNSLTRTAIYWHFPGYLDRPVTRGRDQNFRTRPVTVMRHGDWKLHLYHEEWLLDGGAERLDQNRAVELYNLANDIGERTDLASTQPEQRDKLLSEMQDWMKRTHALLPTPPGGPQPALPQPLGSTVGCLPVEPAGHRFTHVDSHHVDSHHVDSHRIDSHGTDSYVTTFHCKREIPRRLVPALLANDGESFYGFSQQRLPCSLKINFRLLKSPSTRTRNRLRYLNLCAAESDRRFHASTSGSRLSSIALGPLSVGHVVPLSF